ncbi:MAG TPA: GspH/FimT family pseudopilin [Gemmatimonadaceae bacterium]|nr:GspH/FimT family pseudopilin [Gemmatimonadaceae bacterium]
MRPARANTLPELLIALTLVAVIMALAVPHMAASLDRAAAHSASQEIESIFAAARSEALARHCTVWVVIDSAGAAIHLRVPGRGTRTRLLGSVYGVVLSATRDSMSYDGRGLGRGAANLTVIVARGLVRDTVVVSRLGRVRR